MMICVLILSYTSRLQGTTKEDTSSPKQQPLDSQRKSTNKNMLTISSEADPKEEAAATAVPDPQRPVRGAKRKLGMRRTGRVSGSSPLVGAVSSPSAGKVFQCSQCVCKQATLWCSQCSAAYCGICWLRSPAHSKTDIVPLQSSGPRPPYFTVDTDVSKSDESPFPKTGFVSSGPCVHNEFKSHIPLSKSQHFLIYHHDFERVGAVARRQNQILPPVVLDTSGTFLHAQFQAEVRPFSRP